LLDDPDLRLLLDLAPSGLLLSSSWRALPPRR
jgi:hypothetical protein